MISLKRVKQGVIPLGLLILALILGLGYGPVSLSWHQLLTSIEAPGLSTVSNVIVWDIRLPRLIAAALVGGSLALAGAIMQALFKNPLADPYIIGASSGAGFGAVMVSLLWPGSDFLGLGAFSGSLAAVFAAYVLARGQGRVHMLTLILIGYALSLVLGAFTTFAMLANRQTMSQIFAWELGGIHGIGWTRLLWPTVIMLGTSLLVLPAAPELNAYYLGEEQAHYLGVNVALTQSWLLILASLLTAMAVYLAGLIGFVGLVIPHIVRRLYGADHATILPLVFLIGAVFLVVADIIAEHIPGIGTVPLGLVSAVIGGPYFIYLLIKTRVVKS
jgi:iron complex transport system permease protein